MTKKYSIIHNDLMIAETEDEKYDALIQAIEYLSEKVSELESKISCYSGCDSPSSSKAYQMRAKWPPPEGEIDLKTPLKNIALTKRTQNNCYCVGLTTVEDLTNTSAEDLAQTRRFGRKSLHEIIDFLHRYGLSLKGLSKPSEDKG